MIYSLSRHLPQPLGLRGVLPVLCAVAGFGAAGACAAEASEAAHTHPVELAAGDFVRAVVKQTADIRVELLDPDGREILHVDGPNSISDDEEIAAVAAQAGLHRLRVHGCPESAPAAACYTLELDPPRPATEADRRRAEAVRTTQEAVDAMAEGTPESLLLQLTTRERALELWSGLGARRRVAEELYQLGAVHHRLRQFEPASRQFHQAAEAWAALGETAREAEALNDAARACREAGHLDEAREDFRQALARAREADDRRQQRKILNNLGLLLNHLGERQEALENLQQALDLAQEPGIGGQANVLNSLGMVYGEVEPEKSIELHRRALASPEATPFDRATAHNNLGAIHAALGNLEETIESYNQAIAINRRQKDRYHLAATLNNLGRAQHYAGEVDAARASYEEALRLARETGNRETQILAGNSFALLLNLMGQPEKAREQWQEVVRLTAGDPLLDYVGLNARAMVEHGERKFAAARATLEEAISLAQRKAEPRFAADLILQLARMERDLGDLAVAAEHARTAVESIESLRNRVSTPDQRALLLASRQSFYTTYIDILMALHQQRPGERFDARALEVSEQARARSLLDLLGEAETDLRKDVPPELLERERRARVSLRERDLHHMELIHRGAGPEQIAQAAERLNEALDESAEVEEAILRASSASYAALTRPQPLDVRGIQTRVLDDRTLLLEYSLGEERSYLWALTASTFQSFELPGRKEIATAALGFYNAITARNGQVSMDAEQADAAADRAALELSRTILAPVEKLLEDRILLVVSDGVLQYIPFAALPLPSAPRERVARRNQVVSLPSASTLALLRRDTEGRPAAPKTLAVLADPVFPGDPRLGSLREARHSGKTPGRRGSPARGTLRADQLKLERLPFSAQEAHDILAFVEPGQRLAALGFEASYDTATSGELARYRYVHFATHGLIDSQQPKLSKLALSQFDAAGHPQDGFLRLADIYNLQLNADLVVLSACQTALGKEVRGEGLVGLTRGFMYAGASRVLASLWSVEDRATAKLMKSFYRHLLAEQRPAADALRRAQLDLAGKPPFDSPYYWAGFSLQGEWK